MDVIRFEQVSKKFVLHHEKNRSFQDMFVNVLRRNGGREDFWALRDVSFRVEKGQTVGIIGKNGAGKSTILKLVSRIIEPTSGEIEVNGKVSALLELGAGFQGELSGRDNIYLNGSIYGFTRRQMEEKYRAIVDFSELGKFIDTPIKHYSSGMFMRLGFAVAINMDPDILIVDEILSVGDARFQQKCIDALFRFKEQGKSLLFVSHDIGSVRRFCDKVLLMSAGREVAYGDADQVIDEYIYKTSGQPLNGSVEEDETIDPQSETDESQAEPEQAKPKIARIDAVRFLDKRGEETDILASGDPLTVEVTYTILEEMKDCIIGVLFFNEDGIYLCGDNTDQDNFIVTGKTAGQWKMHLSIPKFPVRQGRIEVSVAIADHAKGSGRYDLLDHHHRRYTFEVVCNTYPDGLFLIDHHWEQPVNDKSTIALRQA